MQRKNYQALGLPVGPYVHATTVSGLLFTSGLTAFGTPAQTGSVGQQLHEIFRQLQVIAKAEEISLRELAKVTIFLTSFDRLDEVRAALHEVYDGSYPASSLVQVAGLFSPDLLVEVEGVLAVAG